MGFQFQSIASLSSFVVTELGINFAQLGLLIGFYLLPGVVIAYPSGLLSQRFGDKRIAILGMALMVVGGGLTAFGHSYPIFLVGRLVSGVGAVLLNVVLTKMVTDWFVGRELGTALALLVSSWPVGIGAALIILPPLAGAASAKTALALPVVMAAIILVLMAGIYRASISTENVSAPKIRPAFAISQREFGLVSLTGVVWALFNVGYIVLISFGPSLLMAQGISLKAAGVATSLASWTVIPTIALGGILVDRLGHATSLMVTSLAALALSIMLMPSSSSFALIAFIGAVGGLPCGAMLMLPTEVLSSESRSPGMGIFYTWYYVGMALLTPLAGFVRDFTGNAGAPLTFAGFLEIAAIAVLFLLRLLEHRERLAA